MEADEYKLLREDSTAFYWNKVFPRYLTFNNPDFKLTMGAMKQALQEWDDFGAYSNKMLDINFNDYGALMYYCRFCQAPFETIMCNLRGILGASSDLRRKKEELIETIDVMFDTYTKPGLDRALTMDSTGYVAPITMVFLAHSILNPKQFGEVYWRSLKKIIDAAVSANKRIYAFSEAYMLRFADYFQDVPKGTMMIHLEQDDIFEFRKKLPNIAVAGGMPTTKLGGVSSEECVSFAKELIDTLGDGYVFCQNKMVSYRNDCTRENLLAVNEFVRNYKY